MSFLSVPISIQTFLGPSRKIGNIAVNVILNESTNDTLTITKQPVQTGASITDHAYLEPTAFSMTAYFQDNSFSGSISALATPFSQKPLAIIYQQLLDLQSSAVPFDVVTPKRLYKSMLIASLGQTTDKLTENCLKITVSFQQIILVAVTTTTVPRELQRFPGGTGATQPGGNKSAIRTFVDGVTGR